MSAALQRLIAAQAEAFAQHDARAFTEAYIYPFVAEVDGEIFYFSDAESHVSNLKSYLASMAAARIIHVAPKVDAVEMPRNDRFRVWLTWTYYTSGMQPAKTSHAIFYIRQIAGRLKVEMTELGDCRFVLGDDVATMQISA